LKELLVILDNIILGVKRPLITLDRYSLVLLAKLKRKLKAELPRECYEKALKVIEEFQAEIEEELASTPWP